MSSPIETCPGCNGAGTLYDTEFMGYDDDGNERWEDFPYSCEECGGSGWLIDEVWKQFKPADAPPMATGLTNEESGFNGP